MYLPAGSETAEFPFFIVSIKRCALVIVKTQSKALTPRLGLPHSSGFTSQGGTWLLKLATCIGICGKRDKSSRKVRVVGMRGGF